MLKEYKNKPQATLKIIQKFLHFTFISFTDSAILITKLSCFIC